MTDSIENPARGLAEILGIDAERVFGYIFSSALFVVCVYGVFPALFTTLKTDWGVGWMLLLSLLPGSAVYIFYRRFLGEYFIYPLQHAFHGFLDLIFGFGRKTSSPVWFLWTKGVGLIEVRAAYDYVRESVVAQGMARKLSINHGEIHVFYLSAVMTLGFYLASGNTTLLIAAAISLLMGLLVDTRIHKFDCAAFRSMGHSEIVAILEGGGFRLSKR